MKSSSRGIPTGSPLSPMLGNLLLDRFDELVFQEGGRLIRYGDDFLILCRDEDSAQRLFLSAQEEAEQLQMSLNEVSSEVIDFDEPFRFVGFDFVRHDRWQTQGSASPRLLEELGWHDASKPLTPQPAKLLLPGETGQQATDFGLTAIIGPDVTHLELRPDAIGCHYLGGRPATSIPLADLETLVVLGNIGISSVVLEKLMDRRVHVILADSRGNAFAGIMGDTDFAPDVLAAQVKAQSDSLRCLGIARSLVVSKVSNYARLAGALQPQSELSLRLLDLANKCSLSERIEQLRGMEGAAAALWYGHFGDHLGKGFSFATRVAPAADDPVNVLLNIAQTHLYRMMVLAIRSAGLCSSIGFLHSSTGRFAALASDLQESFRFLMDRTVIEATWQLRPADFVREDRSEYPLSMKNHAMRSFQKMLWRTLHLDCRLRAEQEESTSYLVLMQRQARQLRRHLLNPEFPFDGIRLP
jgi:CRISPR-associated protein Cas1